MTDPRPLALKSSSAPACVSTIPSVCRPWPVRWCTCAEKADVRRVVDHPVYGVSPKFILGGGSNVVLTRDVEAVVLKVEIAGHAVAGRDARRTGSWNPAPVNPGTTWWPGRSTTDGRGWKTWPLVPGSVGAAPVQNIGAYGLELKDRFHSLDAVDLVTGRSITLDAAQCRFGYRDSVFKQHLAGKSVITRVRLALPRPWRPVLGYLDLERRMARNGQRRSGRADPLRLDLQPSAAPSCPTRP
jgi:UDP-N-acetylmuramate dehydrogenase